MYIRNVGTKKSARCHKHEERNMNFRHCENVNFCKWVNKIRSSDEIWNRLTWSIKTKSLFVLPLPRFILPAAYPPGARDGAVR